MRRNLRHTRLLRPYALGAIGICFLLLLAPSAHANPAPPRVRPAIVDAAARNALLQFSSQGHVLGFQAGGFYVSNATYALRVEFVDANPVAPTSDAASESESNPRGAPRLSRVTYPNLWDGITLTYDGARGGVVSSSYRLEAGADPRAIRLHYNAPVTLNSDGTLTIAYATGEMIESAPVAWQDAEGERVPVIAAFTLLGEREVGFGLGEYDAAQPLYIDPKLVWNTFLGGSGNDFGSAIAVDGSGSIYVAGSSTVTWQGATVPVRAYTGGLDAYAAKLSSNGALMWNTFLGESGDDTGGAIAVDGSGNVYVAGYSTATWQGATAPVRAHSSGVDAFAAKLNSNGALTWNTFLGGSGTDFGDAIALDGSGNVYVAGTSSATWQGTDPPVRTYAGGLDAFAAKLSSNGALTWNTFLGSSSDDYGNDIAVDGGGNVYVAGSSDATWQGTSPPVRFYSSAGDAFAAKLNSSGAMTWNTFLGGSGTDAGFAIAADAGGNVYVAGYSTATWQGATGPTRDYTSGNDAFAAKLSSSGALTWNAFLGGSGNDWGWGIAVDGGGNVEVVGQSDATWQGATVPIRPYSSGIDAFAAKLSSSGALTWNGFLGGSGNDLGYSVAVDGNGVVYVAGASTAAWQDAIEPVRGYSSGYDAFVARIGEFGVYLPFMIR